MMRTSVFLFALSIVPALFGQGGECVFTLSGRVIDDHDRTSLPYAEIFLPGIGRGTIADEAGRFRMAGICAGRQLVRVTHVGCEPVERTVTFNGDVEMEFLLEHHVEELRELEVERRRPDEVVGQEQSTVDRGQMELAAGRSVAEMLAMVPGVTLLNAGPNISKPVIHGMYGNRILTMNQGVRQEDQQWGTEHAPLMDPLSTDRITVIKGAATVEYGADAMAGVIQMEPVELPRSAGIAGEMALVGVTNGRGGGLSGLLEGGLRGLRGFGWRVQGSTRMLGDAQAPDYVLSNTGLREAGGSASVGWQDHRRSFKVYYSWFGRDLGIMRAAHIGNTTDLLNAIARGEPAYQEPFTYAIDAPRQRMGHHLLKAEMALRTTDLDQVVVTYAVQLNDRQEFDRRRGGRSAQPAMDMQLFSRTVDVAYKHFIGSRVHGKVGISGMQQVNYNVPGTGVWPLLPDHDLWSGGVFLVEHVHLGKVEVEMGARLEQRLLQVRTWDDNDEFISPEHRFTNHAFSIGASLELADSVVWRANLATAYRPPTVNEMYSQGLHHGSAAIEEGDVALGSERALNAITGLSGMWWGGALQADVSLHASRIADYIYLSPDGFRLTVRGAFPVFRFTSTDALISGGDLTVKARLHGPWWLRSRNSIVRGRDLVQNAPLYLMPADRSENSLMLEIGDRGRWREVSISFTSTFVARQVREAVDADLLAPPAGYTLLGAAVDGTLPTSGGAWRIGLRVDNLLNNTYRDYLDRFRYYADAMGANISVWMRYSFGSNRATKP